MSLWTGEIRSRNQARSTGSCGPVQAEKPEITGGLLQGHKAHRRDLSIFVQAVVGFEPTHQTLEDDDSNHYTSQACDD